MRVSMQDVLTARAHGVLERIMNGSPLPDGANVVQVQHNPFRLYCNAKGIKGKNKKRLRKELRRRERERASAIAAQAEKQSTGGLVQ